MGVVAMLDGRFVWAKSEPLGLGTNNQAEWHAAIAALEWAATTSHQRIELRMDSQLVVNQLEGRWRVKTPGLRPLAERGWALLDGLRRAGCVVRVQWVPRERNHVADALAARAR